jgi:hypothetical protein
MYTGQYHAVSRVASEDYNSDSFYLHAVEPVANVNFKVKLAQAGLGFGILANKPKAGENATVVTEGEVEARVGVAVQAGQWAAVANSGWLINVASTTAITVLGRFVTGAASGMIAVVDVDVWRGPTA